MMKTIGVVVTTFNGERFIKEQIESILNQTLQPNTIVVVDDNSKDNTPKIMEELCSQYSNIKFYENAQTIGYIRNFQRGIALCSTDYIALCDQDDIWHPNKLSICFEKLSSNSDYGLCYHDASLMYEDGTLLSTTLSKLSRVNYCLSKKEAQNQIVKTGWTPPGFAMFFDSKLKKYILPCPGKKFYGHDWWITALSFFMYNPVYIDLPLTYYRLHSSQASGALDCLLENTTYEKKKKLLDWQRTNRNFKRIVQSIFHRRRTKANRKADNELREKELLFVLKKLYQLIEGKKGNDMSALGEEMIKPFSEIEDSLTAKQRNK